MSIAASANDDGTYSNNKGGFDDAAAVAANATG
jgi:hypothetical protein